MKQSSAMSDERPADDAALIERAWVTLKERCCAKPVEAKRCVMVSRADFAAALNAELSERIEEVERLRDAVTKCADKFDFYEQLHRLKCTAEGDEKADRNREMADMCRAALPTPSRGGHDAG